jgi:hypothetical protein
MQILSKLLVSIVTGMALTEGKNSLRCENNQMICFPRNVKARGKEVRSVTAEQEYPVSFTYLFVVHLKTCQQLRLYSEEW